MKRILVIGATGNVGTFLTEQLLEMDLPFRILVRDPKKVEHLDLKVERAVADLDEPDTLEEAVSGIDSIFLLTSNHSKTKMLLTKHRRQAAEKLSSFLLRKPDGRQLKDMGTGIAKGKY